MKMAKVNKDTNYGVLLQDTFANDLREHPEMAGKLANAFFASPAVRPFVNLPMLNIAQNIANAMVHHASAAKAQGKSEIPNSSAVSDANAYDPSIKLNNNVQYVMNLLKTYGYSQQVLDSFKQNIDKILANTKDNNKIDTANQYIDQFLGDKQDLRRLDPVPGKPALDQPAPNQQPQKAGNKNKPGKKPRMSNDEIDAFLKEELGGNTTGDTYASSGVPKGGTKTIGYEYDPNPGNVSLAYTLRNAPEQVRRSALIEKWNRENGRSGSTYATPGMSTGGTYATGEGIKDANGNVLTNPGGDWEYQYALKNPQYGLGMMGKMSDAQKKYLQAVSDDMGYKYNFTGATRFV